MSIEDTVKKVVKRVTRKRVEKKAAFGAPEEIPTRRGHDGQVYRNVDNARSM